MLGLVFGGQVNSLPKFNFVDKIVYLKWRPHGAGAYMGINIYFHTANSIPPPPNSNIWHVSSSFFTTGHTFGGSITLQDNRWYYSRVVFTASTMTAFTAQDNYDDAGGIVVDQNALILSPNSYDARVTFGISDQYASTGANLTIGEVRIVDTAGAEMLGIANIGATVGEGSVFLRWNPPGIPVDRYLIAVEKAGFFKGILPFEPSTVQMMSGTSVQDTNVLVMEIPADPITNQMEGIENDVLYTFRISAQLGNQIGRAAIIQAIPKSFSGQSPGSPTSPLLFLHGFWGDGRFTSDGTFHETLRFLSGTLGWTYGGQLYHLGNDLCTGVERVGQCDPRNPPCLDYLRVDPGGDFFTASFGNTFANYDDNRGLELWGDEVGAFLNKLTEDGALQRDLRKATDVAHSNGGLAVRDYLSRYIGLAPDPGRTVSRLVTYGTPHLGADLLGGLLIQIALGLGPGGARDAVFSCAGSTIVLSSFLYNLYLRPLPTEVSYFSIAGHSDSRSNLLQGLRGDHRGSDCHSEHWDGLVPISSADLRRATILPVTHIETNQPHLGQGNDFPTILCAIQSTCMQIKVMSPVDLEVTAPDGGQMFRDLAAIPGASYMRIEAESGHETATVLIPFPLPGEYRIQAVPKPGAAPTDTFTISVIQGGIETVVAQDLPIRDAPAGGFHVRSNTPPVANAGSDQTVECATHMGTPVGLDGRASTDADGDTLTYEWRDFGGNLLGSSALLNLTLSRGTHQFTLTVSDNMGASSSDTVIFSIKDTTRPVLILAPAAITVLVPTASAASAAVDLSGIATATDTCDPSPVITNDAPALFPVGTTSVTFTARDVAGESSQQQMIVNVRYQYMGPLMPIRSDGSSVFKQGRVIPIKFALAAVDSTVVNNATAMLQLFQVSTDVQGTVLEMTPESLGAITEDYRFRFDPESGIYILNLSTRGLPAGTYLLRIRLNDGTDHDARISIR